MVICIASYVIGTGWTLAILSYNSCFPSLFIFIQNLSVSGRRAVHDGMSSALYYYKTIELHNRFSFQQRIKIKSKVYILTMNQLFCKGPKRNKTNRKLTIPSAILIFFVGAI